jgi:hypothetical protein
MEALEWVKGWKPAASRGKMRAAMESEKSKTVREARMARARAIAATPAFEAGTLDREHVDAIWGTPLMEEYARKYFAAMGWALSEGFKLGCGKCLSHAMGLTDGEISEPELESARQHRVGVEARRALRRSEKAARRK